MSNKVNNYNVVSNIVSTQNKVGIEKSITPIKEVLVLDLDNNLSKEDGINKKVNINNTDINMNNIVAGKLTLIYNNLNEIYNVVKDQEFQTLKDELNNDYVTYVKNNEDVNTFAIVVKNKLDSINDEFKGKIISSVSSVFQNSVSDVSYKSKKDKTFSLGQALVAIFIILYDMQVANSKIDSDILKSQMQYFKQFIDTLTSILIKYEEVEKKQNQAAMVNLAGAITGLTTTVGGFAVALAGMNFYRNSHIDKLSHDADRLESKMKEFFNTKNDKHDVLTAEEQNKLKNFLKLNEPTKEELKDEKAKLTVEEKSMKEMKGNKKRTMKEIDINKTKISEDLENNNMKLKKIKEKIEILEKENTQELDQQKLLQNNQALEGLREEKISILRDKKENESLLKELDYEETKLQNIDSNLATINNKIKLFENTEKLDDHYDNLDKFKNDLLKVDANNHTYINQRIHDLEHKGSLSKIVEGLHDSAGSVITSKYIKQLLNKTPEQFTPDEIAKLHQVAKLQNLYDNGMKDGTFFNRFDQVRKFYETQQRRYSHTSDTMQNSARAMSTGIEAFGSGITAQANKKQSEASADISRAEQLMRLNTGYTDNRKKSYDTVVDQLLQLIFKLNEEIGSLAR